MLRNNLNRHIVLGRTHTPQVSALLGSHCANIKRWHAGGILPSWDTLAPLNAAAGRMFPPPALQETSPRASELPYSPAPLLVRLWNNAESPPTQRHPLLSPPSSLLPTSSVHPFPIPLLRKNLGGSHKKSFTTALRGFSSPLNYSSHLWL